MIFITGGVRSGKSSFAEKFAVKRAMETGRELHYIATGVASDEEMKTRILRHRREREESLLSWKTWEQPMRLDALATSFGKNDIILLDCVTTLLNNELFSIQGKWNKDFLENVFYRILTGIEAIEGRCHELILVSNEVLHEPMMENELVLSYNQILGNLHQVLVRKADMAYLVEAGIPILMKGDKQ